MELDQMTPDRPTKARAGTWLVARALALLTISAGFVLSVIVMNPVEVSTATLMRDLRASRVDQIRCDQRGANIDVYWVTNKVLFKKASVRRGSVAQANDLPAFEMQLTAWAGRRTSVRCPQYHENEAIGFIFLIIPVAYVLMIPLPSLRYAAIGIGLTVLVVTLLPLRRRAIDNNFAWFWLCLITGAGFWAYLWHEPQALASFRGREVGWLRPKDGVGAILATALAAAILCLAGVAAVQTLTVILQ